MSDPRNVAHAKKVNQEKRHQGGANAVADGGPTGRPGKKTAVATLKADPASTAAQVADATDDSVEPTSRTPAPPPAALEASFVVLAQLKDLDFHSRAHLVWKTTSSNPMPRSFLSACRGRSAGRPRSCGST